MKMIFRLEEPRRGEEGEPVRGAKRGRLRWSFGKKVEEQWPTADLMETFDDYSDLLAAFGRQVARGYSITTFDMTPDSSHDSQAEFYRRFHIDIKIQKARQEARKQEDWWGTEQSRQERWKEHWRKVDRARQAAQPIGTPGEAREQRRREMEQDALNRRREAEAEREARIVKSMQNFDADYLAAEQEQRYRERPTINPFREVRMRKILQRTARIRAELRARHERPLPVGLDEHLRNRRNLI